MTTTLPPLGAFLRPIGVHRYGYCLRVVRHFPEGFGERAPAIEYERWGLSDGQPVDDGHVRAEHYIKLIPALTPGVWQYPPPPPTSDGFRDGYRYATPGYRLWEAYYRLMNVNERGQKELFA